MVKWKKAFYYKRAMKRSNYVNKLQVSAYLTSSHKFTNFTFHTRIIQRIHPIHSSSDFRVQPTSSVCNFYNLHHKYHQEIPQNLDLLSKKINRNVILWEIYSIWQKVFFWKLLFSLEALNSTEKSCVALEKSVEIIFPLIAWKAIPYVRFNVLKCFRRYRR